MLCVGLGNPGPQYAQNRHNAGFMLLDELYTQARVSRPWLDTPLYWLSEIEHPFPAYLLKPKTYMNLSGHALQDCVARIQIPLERIVVCYDDLALPLGAMRWRGKGSSGGQKGMGHIIETLGTQDLTRLRLGIGSAAPDQDVPDYVLSDFSAAERQIFKKLMGTAIKSLVCWAEHGVSIAMSRFNGLKLIDPDNEK